MAVGDAHVLVCCMCFNAYIKARVLSWPSVTHICRFVVCGLTQTLRAKVISWRLLTHMCFLAFSHEY